MPNDFYNLIGSYQRGTTARADTVKTDLQGAEAGFALLPTLTQFKNNLPIGITTAGSANTYTLADTSITSYTTFLTRVLKINAANTGACTLNINSVGAVAIKKADLTDLEAGDLTTNSIIIVVYNGTYFVMVSSLPDEQTGCSLINYPHVGRNYIINGMFAEWQRGTSQTSNDYDSDDMFFNGHSGTTKTHSRQSLSIADSEAMNGSTYYSRTVVTTSAGAANYCYKYQCIEGVQRLAGKTVTLTFWAKADAAKNIAVELTQSFGTGGSASAGSNALDVTTIALTTSWVKQSITMTVPSISGKTLDGGDDYTRIIWWFDAGSDFNSRTNTLGQQSGTFDIDDIQLEEGSVATDFEVITQAANKVNCYRYCYEVCQNTSANEAYVTGQCYDTNYFYGVLRAPVEMRDTPSVTFSAVGTFRVANDASVDAVTGISASNIGKQTMIINANGTFTQAAAAYLSRDSSDTTSILLEANL